MDSIKAVVIDTLNRHSISAKFYNSPDSNFEKIWFPIILLGIGALISFLSSWLTTLAANRREDKIESQKTMHEAFVRINEIDRAAALEINLVMMSGGGESKISELSLKIERLEQISLNVGYRFEKDIKASLLKVIKLMDQYRYLAFDATARNGFLNANVSTLSQTEALRLQNEVQKVQDDARVAFEQWRAELPVIEKYLKG